MNDTATFVVNPNGARRIVVTKDLPGARWSELLTQADCRIEIARSEETLDEIALRALIGGRCDGVIGQLTEPWSSAALETLARAGGKALSLYAVGYDNVDIEAATRLGLQICNTPGILTETTAEMAVALTFAAARRVAEGDRAVRAGRFTGWLPGFMLGELLWRKTLGIVGAGRIGTAYARMMVEGHKVDLLYYSPRRNEHLERLADDYSDYLIARGEQPITCRRVTTLDELLEQSDIVSLHTTLNETTFHLIGCRQLARMKRTAVLVNTSRGPVLDEAALVEHCRRHPGFRAGLDVYEGEPRLSPGLDELDNVVLAPHLGSATRWTREGMAILAAANVAAVMHEWPVWPRATTLDDVLPFFGDSPPEAAPSIVNAAALGLTPRS